MNRYSVDHDIDFDLYYVVQHTSSPNVGTVVHIAYTERSACDWIKATEYEENSEIFAEFG